MSTGRSAIPASPARRDSASLGSVFSTLTEMREQLTSRAIDLALAPARYTFAAATRTAKFTTPPVFHLIVLASLLPLISFWSLGAGLVVRGWIPKGWRQVLYMTYGDGTQSPYADVALPTLVQSQPYDFVLELVLPLFADNVALGNFMSTISVYTPANVTIATSSRPSLIFPQSVAYAPLIYSGAVKTQLTSVRLLDEFSTYAYLSSLRARIEVGRRDGWRNVGSGEGRELVVAEAFLRGIPRMVGLRGFFMRHDILLLALVTTAFFISTSSVALALYMYYAPGLVLEAPESDSKISPEASAADDPFSPEDSSLRTLKPEPGDIPPLSEARIKAELEEFEDLSRSRATPSRDAATTSGWTSTITTDDEFTEAASSDTEAPK